MLHLIAFVVIGLVVGWWLSRGYARPAVAVILGLIGGLVGGYAVVKGLPSHHTIVRYGSLIASIVVAAVLAAAGRGARRA